MFARFPLYMRLVRLDKPIGSLLLLWPTLNALWIASSGQPSSRAWSPIQSMKPAGPQM